MFFVARSGETFSRKQQKTLQLINNYNKDVELPIFLKMSKVYFYFLAGLFDVADYSSANRIQSLQNCSFELQTTVHHFNNILFLLHSLNPNRVERLDICSFSH